MLKIFCWHKRTLEILTKEKKEYKVVVKLAMAKSYDKVSWIFLAKVLQKFCFLEMDIDMVWSFYLIIGTLYQQMTRPMEY